MSTGCVQVSSVFDFYWTHQTSRFLCQWGRRSAGAVQVLRFASAAVRDVIAQFVFLADHVLREASAWQQPLEQRHTAVNEYIPTLKFQSPENSKQASSSPNLSGLES
ncbi:hypothetical protein B0H14DRAFT_2617793 [Mycena olivaceomarginata]|nr:hypothetical protein B0H14DRAFT_2617793 [Mycena olivaceomarginata]